MYSKGLRLIVFICILALAFWLRKVNYAVIPVPGQSVDEYSYSWVGLSLIETGVPAGISDLKGYKNEVKQYINVDRFYQTVADGNPMDIRYPWFDHPPLLGLITGGYAYIAGARVFEETTAQLIRRPIIVIGTISVGLTMVFCWLNFGFVSAVFVGLIYGTVPLAVLSSRMIQAENAIIPCLLLVMIAIGRYIKTDRDRWLILAGIVSGVATLFKLTGVVCYLLVFFALLEKYGAFGKRFWKDLGFFLLFSIPISGLFGIYGMVLDFDVFKQVLMANFGRYYGLGTAAFYELLRNHRLTQRKFLPEVWITVGWLAFFLWSVKKKREIGDVVSILGVVAYLGVYVFMGSQPYGWYTFPFWPLVFIILARFSVVSLGKRKYFLPVMLVSIMVLGENIARLFPADKLQGYMGYWRFGVVGVLVITLVLYILRLRANIVGKVVLVVVWALLIVTNILYLNGISVDSWWRDIS